MGISGHLTISGQKRRSGGSRRDLDQSAPRAKKLESRPTPSPERPLYLFQLRPIDFGPAMDAPPIIGIKEDVRQETPNQASTINVSGQPQRSTVA